MAGVSVLRSEEAYECGGLSGSPLFNVITAAVGVGRGSGGGGGGGVRVVNAEGWLMLSISQPGASTGRSCGCCLPICPRQLHHALTVGLSNEENLVYLIALSWQNNV